MSGQYKIMYSSMDQFYDQTNGRMAEWVSQLEPWVKACENLGNMECYQGKSAESVKTYLKEVHMTLLTYRILYKRNECDIVSVGRLFRKFTYAGALSACTDSE